MFHSHLNLEIIRISLVLLKWDEFIFILPALNAALNKNSTIKAREKWFHQT
jgi:hypothetical protein